MRSLSKIFIKQLSNDFIQTFIWVFIDFNGEGRKQFGNSLDSPKGKLLTKCWRIFSFPSQFRQNYGWVLRQDQVLKIKVSCYCFQTSINQKTRELEE